MSPRHYVVVSLNPADSTRHAVYVRERDSNTRVIQVKELSELPGMIVTHDSWIYAELLRSHRLTITNDVFDVNQYKKFATGRPKSDFSKQRPWDTLSIVSNCTPTPMSGEEFWAFMWSGDRENQQAGIATSNVLLNAIEHQYENAWRLRKASAKGFFDVEVPLQKILLDRQVKGIKLDASMVSENLAALDAEYFDLLANLREKHGYRGDLFDTSYLYDYIRETALDTVFDFGMASVDRELEYLSAFSEPLDLLRRLRRLQLTKSALSKISEPTQDRVFPVFDPIGSVTGRINVVEPLIQQLKKEYRSNFSADEGYELVYVDYVSFEPRILASLSNDDRLTQLLRTQDFYVSLGELLGLAPEQRGGAKSIFLQYMYGAADSTMATYLRRLRSPSTIGGGPMQRIQHLKSSFQQVEAWKGSVEAAMKREDFVSVGHGVVREIRHTPASETIATRRIVNHLIQGAGASFMKRLILQIGEDVPSCQVLLPMHDALLLQIPSEGIDQTKETLEDFFVAQFNDMFGTDLGQVSFKSF